MRYNFLFVICILSMTLGLVAFHSQALKLYSVDGETVAKSRHLERKLARQELENQVLAQNLFDYQQSVAATLGKSAEARRLVASERNLLVSSRRPAQDSDELSSSQRLARGKELFSQEKYGPAVQEFQTLIDRYNGTPASIEARFLKAEALYLMGEVDSAVEEIETMVSHYPDYSMTGYLMIRLSQVLHYRKRTAEAAEVLKYIQRHFASDSALQAQVRSLDARMKAVP